jgi:hypothetical protein
MPPYNVDAPTMEITKLLNEKILESVQTSMLIEGYTPERPEWINEQARLLMERHGVQVSLPSQ